MAYDFAIIPPELISSIYEQLLEETQQEHSAYYTPRHVVDLILDETVPWDGHGSPRILDPACGSGIFLTESFRRLAFRLSLTSDHDVTFERLSEIVTSSIHGVDQSESAIQVAAFGIYLALLEELEPPAVWTDVRLPKLIGRNLVVADYFSADLFVDREFDVIVGNPPWRSRLSEAALTFVSKRKFPVPDRQIAYAFLWRAAEMLASDGVLALLMPSKSLLHNKSMTALGRC